jgi:hypothetical protein
MERQLVWYGDIDSDPISDDQYISNMYHQIHEPSLPKDLSIKMLENVADYIPLVTDNLRIAFCQVTHSLPELCQVQIWAHTLAHGTESLLMPRTPEKKREISSRMKAHMARWATRKHIEF